MKNELKLLLLLFCLATAVAAKAYDFTYTANLDGTINITGYTGSDSVLVVPASIEGKTVASIGDLAFDNCSNLTAISVDAGNTAYSSVDGILFNKSQTTLIRYPAGKSGNYAIPGTVASVGHRAFQRCIGLSGVTIPSGVVSIGAYAFQDCPNLTTVTIPFTVASIGYKAFDYCHSLTSITVNAGNSAYSSLNGILFNNNQTALIQYPAGQSGTYAIPSTVASVGNAAFSSCSRLSGVTIPSVAVTIGAYAFQDCTNLTEVTIASGVANIGNSAFDNCVSLAGVTIPYSITNIGDKAFNNCTNLTSISVDPGNLIYSSPDGVLFNKNQTEIVQCPAGRSGNYTIPNTVTIIGDSAFDNCVSLTGITIPSSVVVIEDAAFENCFKLTAISVDAVNSVYSSVNGVLFDKNQTMLIQCPAGRSGTYAIPNTVVSIDDAAFDNCVSLAGVTVPFSIADIGDLAFDNCTNLSVISVDPGNPIYSSVDGILFNKNQNMLIQYPAGKSGAYVIPNTVTSIAYKAFHLCAGLTSVTIPSSVISISNSAFDNCVSLASVTIPYSVVNIGGLAFNNCTNLSVISVDQDNPIYSSLDGVLFNKNQTALIQYPAGKSGTYTIPNTVTSVGNSVFDNCAKLSAVTIPFSVTGIGGPAFSASLVSVMIPSSVASIGDLAFYSCAGLISATIGNSITSIEDGAFSRCASLMGIYFEGNAPGLGSGVFTADNAAVVYYLQGATGWGQTFGGLPTALWNNTLGSIVKANGASGAITINYPEALSITVAMNAGDYAGIPVDWWAVALAGSSWYYLNSSFQWTQFDGNLLNCQPVHQGPLFNLPPLEVLHMVGLPVGSYTFWFAVNYPMNGILDTTKPMLVDSVNVTIK